MISVKPLLVYRIVIMQATLLLFIVLAAWFFGYVEAYSSLLGGLAYLLPNSYFIWRVFKYSHQVSPIVILQSFYRGETWKFILTALFFAVIFTRVDTLSLYALFGTFIAMQFSHVFAAKVANI
jgi:ATP synthase protein I